MLQVRRYCIIIEIGAWYVMDSLGSESNNAVDSQQFPVEVPVNFMPVCIKIHCYVRKDCDSISYF
jgi:hypothetical protein